MEIKGLGEIQAIAFDIDGTLYAPWQLTKRAVFKYVAHWYFFMLYGLVRNEMHRLPPNDNFRGLQAERMGRKLRCSPEKAESKLDKIVYTGLKKYFQTIPCFENVPETFQKFKEAGFKLALLSDFPPEQKGEVWGVKKYCDVVLGTEQLGALKPDPYSFIKMAEQLGVSPDKILYVGNSRKYDVGGSKRAGMKCAYLLPWWRALFHLPVAEADICFTNYRQLQQFVLE